MLSAVQAVRMASGVHASACGPACQPDEQPLFSKGRIQVYLPKQVSQKKL
jgi:hypothetical protein